ncbi:MAG: DAK2 domain-containing protein [Roseiflexaceae bacterium]|nr:DAK2 domain-containing protein [Roseiflexaceae bacterium]
MDRSAPTDVDTLPESWDGTQLLAALTEASHWLDRNADALNALNVFPVPDGDTGTNMSLTLSGVVRDVVPDPSAAVVAERVTYWALMHGRGNSGIILSQILRGLGLALVGHQHCGPTELVAALAQASTTAYKAILRPVEGTMLTVIRAASHAAAHAFNVGHTSLDAVLEGAVRGARAAVARTPALLKTLRDAGVVDAGGQGLLILLEGLLHYARNTPIPARTGSLPVVRNIPSASVHRTESYGYCTNFVINSAGLVVETVRETLSGLGDSLVVIGDERLVRVHVHTLRPGDVLNTALAMGTLDRVEITNMDQQVAEHGHATQERAVGDAGIGSSLAVDQASEHSAGYSTDHSAGVELAIGVIAVVAGGGFASIFRGLNALIVDGGPGANPSAGDFLAAIDHLPQQQIVLLPNDPDVVAAAQLASQYSDRSVIVVETRSAAQGIAALLRLNPDAALNENSTAMLQAASEVRTLAVTIAARDAVVDGITVQAGQSIGLLDGRLVVAGAEEPAIVFELLTHAAIEQASLLTIYYGGTLQQADAEHLAVQIGMRYNELEIEVHEGGQPLYNYIISVE